MTCYGSNGNKYSTFAISCLFSDHQKLNNMDTVLIQLSSPGIMNILKELEKLKLIRVINTESPTKTPLSEKYGGKLPVQIAAQIQEHVKNSRDEWNNNI